MKNVFYLSKKRWIAFLVILSYAVVSSCFLRTILHFGNADTNILRILTDISFVINLLILFACGLFCIFTLIVDVQLTVPKVKAKRKQSLLLLAVFLVMLGANSAYDRVAIPKLFPLKYAENCVVLKVDPDRQEYIMVQNSTTKEPLKLYCTRTEHGLAKPGNEYAMLEYIELSKDGTSGRLRSVPSR